MVSPHLMNTVAAWAFPGVMMQKQMMAIIKYANCPQRIVILLFMLSP
jgi:hypothetical protein